MPGDPFPLRPALSYDALGIILGLRAMTSSKELADNTALTVIARFAMIGASAMLPLVASVVGFMLLRGINTVDELNRNVDVIRDRVVETNSNVKLIQMQQTSQAALLADHEARVRVLEHFNAMQKPQQ